MSKVKYLFLYGWTLPRVIRVTLGMILILQSIYYGEYLFLIPALLITTMGVFNVGCCSAGGACRNNNFYQNTEKDQKVITYEEVKQ